jgi:hypothetical protein
MDFKHVRSYYKSKHSEIRYYLRLCNDQLNAHVFNVFIYLVLPYMFRAFF